MTGIKSCGRRGRRLQSKAIGRGVNMYRKPQNNKGALWGITPLPVRGTCFSRSTTKERVDIAGKKRAGRAQGVNVSSIRERAKGKLKKAAARSAKKTLGGGMNGKKRFGGG